MLKDTCQGYSFNVRQILNNNSFSHNTDSNTRNFSTKKPKFRETGHVKFLSGNAVRFHEQIKKAGNSKFKTNFEFPAFFRRAALPDNNFK